jgi:hypothetical protein
VQQARQFRDQVKQMVLEVIDNTQETAIDNWLSPLWVILLGIEHERIHLETSAVIMRRVPLELINPVQDFPECNYQQKNLEMTPKNQMQEVPAWRGMWERSKEEAVTYGWDN